MTTPLRWTSMRLEQELIAIIKDQAHVFGKTFSELVRDALWKEFGRLRTVNRKRGKR